MRNKIMLIPLLLSLISHSFATIINIPGDQLTIQAGINASVNGDTVLVQPGTYVENINFNGKNIVLGSEYLITQDTSYISSTIIDGNQNGSVVTVVNGEELSSQIIGFTIRNGRGTSKGGGISIRNASIRISNCIIRDNINYGFDTPDDGGGGIAIDYNGSANISNCLIKDNVAGIGPDNGGFGGGIYVFGDYGVSSVSTVIENCIITNNVAENDGGAINSFSGLITLNNCLIYGNSATNGEAINSSGKINIINSTIVYNPITENQTEYSVSINNENSILVKNSIIWEDWPITINNSMPDSALYSYSDIHGISDGVENIDEYPIFIDRPGNDFRLSNYSPCIGVGTIVGASTTDIEGNPRPNPVGSNPDIGAYENLLATLAPSYGIVDDIIDWSSALTTLTANWSGYTSIAGIAGYYYAIGDDISDTSLVLWTQVDASVTTIIRDDLELQSGKTYHFAVKAYDIYGTDSQIARSDGVTIDAISPLIGLIKEGSVNNDMDWQQSTSILNLYWSGSDSREIAFYEYSVGTSSGDSNIINWTETGIQTSVTTTGLQLVENVTYYANVRAFDMAGNRSGISSGDGIKIDITSPNVGSITIQNLVNDTFIESSSEISCQLTDITDDGSGLSNFRVGIGSTSNSVNILPFTVFGLSTVEFTGLTLDDYQTYYITALALDSVGNISDTISSDPFVVYSQYLGDYDSDRDIDVEDLASFISAWPSSDLGPVTGEVPYLLPSPDGVANLRDIMTFTRMWHWSREFNSAAQLFMNKSFGPIPLVKQKGSILFVTFPKQTIAGEIIAEHAHETELLIPGDEQSENTIVLSKRDPEISQLVINFGFIGEKKPIKIDTKSINKNNSSIKIHYRLFDKNGLSFSEGIHTLDLTPMPVKFALHQNYPNPFNPITTIQYDLSEATNVQVVIYDLLGRQVIKLVNEYQEAGYRSIIWNGRNSSGHTISAGMYFYTIKAGKYTSIKKMVLLK